MRPKRYPFSGAKKESEAKKISLMKRAPIQLLVSFRVIHYNFVSIALEDIL